ncbi:MAG: hypothetical protein K2O00_06740 [Muribaculaceae bacterium]|nr:hypothetical protein [Muribaculaceae bacterium]
MNLNDTINNACDTVAGAYADATENLTEYMSNDGGFQSFSVDHIVTHPDWNLFFELSGYGFVLGILVVIAFLLIWVASKHTPSKLRDISLKVAFPVVWIYGFIVYDVGMCTGEYISLLTNAPMAIIYAFKIFLFDSDVSEIHEEFHSSWVYSLNFALVHFSAAVISTLFLIKYFGFALVSYLRIWWAATFGRRVDETFVFRGLNKKSAYLIKDIQKQYGKGTSYRIVIVRTNADGNESPEHQSSMERIFEMLSIPSSQLDSLQELDCLTIGSYVDSGAINVLDGETDILGEKLKMKILRRLLCNKTKRKIHLFYFSDDEKENIHDVALMLHDSGIKGFVKESHAKSAPGDDGKREVLMYCLARYNSVHRVIEDQSLSDKIQVRVVDSSHINVEILKQQASLLPVNYVDVEADATVSSKFNALVVGFSEVGLDSVRFLYEFGAFVKYGSTDEHAVRSEFHLDVIDKNMADLAGTFVANAPAIKLSMPFLQENKNNEAMITLHQLDCRSVEFYNLLENQIATLNYVVIATEDDEMNLSLGVRIFKLATRYRKDMKKLRILIRAHNDDDGHIRRITHHYNRLWAAYECAPEIKGARFHQSEIGINDELTEPLYVFGLESETFTFANIIADELEQKARKYSENYSKTVSPEKEIKISAWDDRIVDRMQLADPWEGYAPTYCGIMNLRRTQSQDFANSQHELTKKLLIEKALKLCKQENFGFSQLTRTPNTTQYVWPHGVKVINDINRIAIVIAQTEHLRWIASHEILGYVLNKDKDEVALMHNYLKDWDLLEENVRSYDCNVADYILGIRFKR